MQHSIYLVLPVDVTTIGNQKLDDIRVASVAGIIQWRSAKLLHTKKVVSYFDTAPESLLTSQHKGVLYRVGADRASSMFSEVNAQTIVYVTQVLT